MVTYIRERIARKGAERQNRMKQENTTPLGKETGQEEITIISTYMGNPICINRSFELKFYFSKYSFFLGNKSILKE